MKAADIDRIARANPGVDREQLREATELIEALSGKGLRPDSYNLQRPFELTPTARRKGCLPDSRTARVRR